MPSSSLFVRSWKSFCSTLQTWKKLEREYFIFNFQPSPPHTYKCQRPLTLLEVGKKKNWPSSKDSPFLKGANIAKKKTILHHYGKTDVLNLTWMAGDKIPHIQARLAISETQQFSKKGSLDIIRIARELMLLWTNSASMHRILRFCIPCQECDNYWRGVSNTQQIVIT